MHDRLRMQGSIAVGTPGAESNLDCACRLVRDDRAARCKGRATELCRNVGRDRAALYLAYARSIVHPEPEPQEPRERSCRVPFRICGIARVLRDDRAAWCRAYVTAQRHRSIWHMHVPPRSTAIRKCGVTIYSILPGYT